MSTASWDTLSGSRAPRTSAKAAALRARRARSPAAPAPRAWNRAAKLPPVDVTDPAAEPEPAARAGAAGAAAARDPSVYEFVDAFLEVREGGPRSARERGRASVARRGGRGPSSALAISAVRRARPWRVTSL